MFEFTKMHALGNDFVIIDGINQSIRFDPTQAKSIAARHTGIGCDQILLVYAGDENVFPFRIYNADGSESAQCGNGARCVARLLADRGYPTGENFILRTLVDDLACTVNGSQITVSLGVPNFDPAKIPFVADREQPTYDLMVDGQVMEILALSVGNPHAVILVDSVDQAPVAETGPVIESHPRFPARTNVGYLEICSRSQVRLRVHERGVGETFACGSGASAAVVAGIHQGLLDAAVEVKLAAGSLFVQWHGLDSEVLLGGPASYVFEGRWNAA